VAAAVAVEEAAGALAGAVEAAQALLPPMLEIMAVLAVVVEVVFIHRQVLAILHLHHHRKVTMVALVRHLAVAGVAVEVVHHLLDKRKMNQQMPEMVVQVLLVQYREVR
jgi:hypothetical protein